jgi:hypothetical protein
MFAILVADVRHHSHHYDWWVFFHFVSRWTLLLQVVYLALRLHESHSRATPSRLIYVLHSIALPSSIAVIPLFWFGSVKIFAEEYADRVIPLSQYFVHGFNAVIMLLDYSVRGGASAYPDSQKWHRSMLLNVICYGATNAVFMAVLYHAHSCDTSPCNLDGEGNPYVYSVVNFVRPLKAVGYCALAVLGTNPLICVCLEKFAVKQVPEWYKRLNLTTTTSSNKAD